MKPMELSPPKRAIMAYLRQVKIPMSPTQIGLDFGHDIPRANSFSSYHCKGIINKYPDALGVTDKGCYYAKRRKAEGQQQ